TTPINTQTCSALPINLLSFQVEATGNGKAAIYWNTGSELNTSQFVIERSNDGVNYSQIGEVDAHTNSQQIIYYSYMDENLPSSGTVYYRLKIVDVDQSVSYSTMRALVLKGTLLSVYPNPVQENKSLMLTYYTGQANNQITIDIINSLGQHLISQS